MAAFTPVNPGDAYLARDRVNELVLAYSERKQCVGEAAVAEIPEGFNLQQLSFWQGMQSWCEGIAWRWVNDTAFSVTGGYTTTDDLTHSFSTLRDAASLPYGFRRATEYPGPFKYGIMVAGDIIGPWIIEDLQAMFDAMRWTCASQSSVIMTILAYYIPVAPVLINTEYREEATGRLPNHPTPLAAYNGLAAEWPPSAVTTSYFYYSAYLKISSATVLGSTIYEAFAARDACEISYGSIPTHCGHLADVYMRFGPWSGTFSDLDSLGVNTTDLYHAASYPESSSNTRVVGKLASIALMPQYLGVSENSINMSFDFILFKWSFSNTL